MKHITIITIFAILSMNLVTARISETVEECDKRYGVPLSSKKDRESRNYRKGLFFIQADFDDQGKCFRLFYSYDEKDDQGKRIKFTHAQLAAILKRNSASKWAFNNEKRRYETADGNVFAYWIEDGTEIVVNTQKAEEKAELEALEGL